MEEKFNEAFHLLPANCEEMLGHLDLTLTPDNNISRAAVYRLKQSYTYFYNKKLTKSKAIAEEILDYSWEMLNTGHWKDVSDASRAIYSFATLLKAFAVAGLKEGSIDNISKEVCRLSDMALLMGVPILNGIFYKIVEIFKPTSRKRKAEERIEDTDIKVSSRCSDLNKEVRLRQENNIVVLHSPSLETFKGYMEKHEPVIIEGSITHWPALASWNTGYLKQVAGHRTVPVEIGSKYTDDEWGQRLMTVEEFIDSYIINGKSSKGYLAQHQLFDQIPELKDDIYVPDYCSVSSSSNPDTDEDVDINAWFGPTGTVSPCHHDPKHNLLAQVVGRKYIRLYHPKYSENLYPRGGASVLTNTSQVDVENPDLSKYPLFEEVDLVHCQEHMLMPGQLLYIPPKHWHYVRSLDISFSVSFWWE